MLLKWQLFLVFFLAAHLAKATATSRAKKPLILTRRRHDIEFLQATRIYQQSLLTEEFHLKRNIRLNLTNDADETVELDQAYYVNDQLEADEVTIDHLIVGAIHQTFRTRLFKFYMATYDRKEDRKRSSDKRLVSRQRCQRDLKYLVENLPGKKRSINPELVAFYDTFGRSEQGLVYGNIHWAGMPSQCEKRLIVDPNEKVVFTGRHCKASIRSPNWNKLIRYQRDKLLEANNYFKYDDQAHDYERFFRIQVGLCLPQSCDSETIDWAHNQVKELAMLNLQEPYNQYDMVDLFCLPDETSELRKIEPMGRALIWTCCFWLTAMLVATVCDKPEEDKNEDAEITKSFGSKLINVMSLKRNWQRLTTNKNLVPTKVELEQTRSEQPSPSDLSFMNFLKVIFAPMIVWAHLILFAYETNKYGTLINQFNYRFMLHAANGGAFIVDAFFTMSGFVTCYIMFYQRVGQRLNAFQWLYVLFKRYWRLAPSYIAVYWFNKHLLMYTSHGPNWDYGTSNMTKRSLCRSESWLYPLTMTSNFRPGHDQCVLSSWSASNDMFFSLLLPFIIVGLNRWPRATWLAVLSALALSTLAAFQILFTSPRISHLDMMRSRNDGCIHNLWASHQLYQYPQYRIGPYLLGLLAAHYAYMVRSGQWSSMVYSHPNSKRQHNERFKHILTASILPLGIVIFCSSYTPSWQLDQISIPKSVLTLRLLVSFLYSVSHIYMGLGIALIVLALTLGHCQRLSRFMSLPIWANMGKLNYFVLLTHADLMWYLFESSETMMNLQRFDYIVTFIYVLFICYLLSAILTLTIEIPLGQLEHEFVYLALFKKSSATKDETTNNNRKKRD